MGYMAIKHPKLGALANEFTSTFAMFEYALKWCGYARTSTAANSTPSVHACPTCDRAAQANSEGQNPTAERAEYTAQQRATIEVKLK